MKDVKGIQIEKLNFELQKAGDIYSFEGPLLSHFKDGQGNNYIMSWVDLDWETANRWTLFKVSEGDLNRYFSTDVTLKKLIYKAEPIYVIDISSDGEYLKLWIVDIEDLPDDYLPDDDSKFDLDFADEYALKFIK